jgi:DNA-binding SARP family transcriptional activator
MRAGESACSCPQCGVVCRGRFAGCAEVWARGPREVHVVSPPAALARRTQTPVRVTRPPARQSSGAEQPGAEQARTEVLAWLQAAFDGLRDELSVLAGGLARQQAVLSDLSENRDTEVATALEEVRGWAAELRNETLRLQGFERAVADQLRADVSATIEQGVDRMVTTQENTGTTRQDDVRQALAEVTERATALREETDRLQGFGQNLAEQLRAEVAQTVQDGMASLMAVAAAQTETPAAEASAAEPTADLAAELREETERLQRFGETLADSVRDAVTSALQQAQIASAAETQPAAPAGPVTHVAPPALPETAPAAVGTPSESVGEPVPERAVEPAADEAPARQPRKAAAASGGAPAVPAALELPSGTLVGPTLATAAVDALTLARVARRRRRIPSTPSAGLHRSDPLLTDVLRRLERFALGRRTGTTARARTGESAGRWGIDALPLGASGEAEVAVDFRELNGVAITGAGAADVVRAMAVTFFCRHRPPAEVLLIGDDLLVGAAGVPGLSRAATVDAALSALGLSSDPAEDDDREPPAQHRSPVRRLALVSGVAEDDVERLRQSVDQRPDLGVSVVSVGTANAQAAATLDVDAGGVPVTVEPSAWADRVGDARLFSLTAQDAAELIALADASRREGDDLLAPELNGEVCNVTEIVGRSATRAMPLIDIRMLGSFRIEVGGEEIRGGLRTKARELLAFHLLHPEGASLDAAVDALWPEADPGRGSEWFWTALGNLRSRLRAACGIKDMKIIDRVGDTYRLEVERFGVDVWRFEEALAASAPGMRHAMPSTDALERAVGEYSGELLTGDPWQWVEGAREDLRRRALDAVAHLAERRMEAGDLDAALTALEHGLEIDAISEELYRRAMEIQGQLSRRDAIRGTFRLLQARLAAYGLTPDPNTEKVFGELVARA